MSINVKKCTKDQMAKMVGDAQCTQKEAEDTAATYFEWAKQLQEQISKMETQERSLRAKNAALTEQIDQMNGEAITRENVIAKLKAAADGLRNKLADTEAALGRANVELTRSVAEKNTLRNDVTKMTGRAALECGRANYAESHPWRNLWAWVKRKMVRHE